jgi:hypothetical protein
MFFSSFEPYVTASLFGFHIFFIIFFYGGGCMRAACGPFLTCMQSSIVAPKVA